MPGSMPGRQIGMSVVCLREIQLSSLAIIIEQHKDYHRASDSTLLYVSTHNVYYVKYNLVFDECLVHTP